MDQATATFFLAVAVVCAVLWIAGSRAGSRAPPPPAVCPPPMSCPPPVPVPAPPLPPGLSLSLGLPPSPSPSPAPVPERDLLAPAPPLGFGYGFGLRERGRRGPWEEAGIVSNHATGTAYALFRRTVDARRDEYEFYAYDRRNGIRMDLTAVRYLRDGDTVVIPAKPNEGTFSVALFKVCPWGALCDRW